MASEKRLIDANARIEEIKKAYCTGCESYGGIRCRACWVDDAIGLIDDATTVAAVEVEDKKLLKAIKILVEQYSHSKRSDYVHSPVAHALYHTWRKLDGEREDK